MCTNKRKKQAKTNVSYVEILFDRRRVGLTMFFCRCSLFDDFYKCLHRYHLFAFQTTACINCSVRFECWKKMCVGSGHRGNKNSSTWAYFIRQNEYCVREIVTKHTEIHANDFRQCDLTSCSRSHKTYTSF